jgi:dephospho-CoA kinase
LSNREDNLFWVIGGPGFGKSVLSSALSKWFLHAHPSLQRDILVAYFFCDDKNEQLKTSEAILRNLLQQILHQRPDALQ